MIRRILLFAFVSRIVFFLFAFLASYLIPLREGYLGKQFYGSEPYLIWIWANFDGRHYLDIVENGYRNFNFAFFPLYPFIIKVLHQSFSVNIIYLGIFISLISFFLATVFIYKIVRLDYKESIAKLTLIFVAFFPPSFFYNAVYSDALFFFLSVASFYFARRGNWLVAGLFGGLTTFDRLAGLALLPALLFEWFLQNRNVVKNWKRKITVFWNGCFSALCLTLLGFLGYLIYLQIKFGNFLLFQEAMVAWRQNEFVFPPQVIFRYLKIFSQVDIGQLVYWVAFLEFVSMVTYFTLTYYVGRKIRWSYAVLMFFILLLPTFTGTFAGMPRYILHAFPSFIGLALLFQKSNNFVKFSLVLAFLLLGFILTGLFTRGYFIA